MDSNQILALAVANVPTIITVLIGILLNNGRISDLNSHMTSFENCMASIENRLTNIENTFVDLDNRLSRIEARGH